MIDSETLLKLICEASPTRVLDIASEWVKENSRKAAAFIMIQLLKDSKRKLQAEYARQPSLDTLDKLLSLDILGTQLVALNEQ